MKKPYAVLILVMAIVLMQASSAYAAFPGANGKIAFTSTRDGNYEIYLMNPDGSGQTNITNNPAADQRPAWSPDGAKIAFVHSGDICVMAADGSGQTNLTSSLPAEDWPAWSPDGTRIVFVRNGDIHVMNADGSGQTNLTNTATGEGSPAWSPDGAKIAFSRDVGAGAGRIDIYVMAPDGSGQAPLITSPLHDDNPNWSPDGSKIAFSSDRAVLFCPDIYVANADGSAQTRLTSTAKDRYPVWSPDGTKIAFGSYRDDPVGYAEIYVMNSDGSGQTPLTSSPSGMTNDSPDWQPVRYGFSGVLQPVNADGSSVFKLGRTVPVKFQLTDATGAHVDDAVARIYVAKISSSVVGDETEAISTSAATEGNLFRYDSAANQYVFNWGTTGLTAGTWRIRIALDDGSSKYVTVSLR